MPDFSQRSHELELMDLPIIDRSAIFRNFDDLVVINRLLGGGNHSISAIEAMLPNGGSVCDVGFGAGDLLVKLMQSPKVDRVIGIDPMKEAHDYALRRFSNLQHAELHEYGYETWFDLHSEVDVIHASLFCHHLTEPQLIDFLSKARRCARVGVAVSYTHLTLPTKRIV